MGKAFLDVSIARHSSIIYQDTPLSHQHELYNPQSPFHSHSTQGCITYRAAQDAARMQRVVSFYEKLPRGAAPDIKPKGLLGRYQAKHFGKNPTGTPIIHAIVFLVAVGYAQNYYFHLRHHKNNAH